MKNLLLALVAASTLVALVGCADQPATTTTTTTEQTSASTSNNTDK